jgi:hypothetical protein
MNPELQKQLALFVQKMIDLVNAGTAQLPAVLQDIVGAAIMSANFLWWIGLVILVVGIALFIIGLYVADGYCSDGVGFFMCGLVGTLGGGILVAMNWYLYLYATRFPRLVILDYLKGLL